jgi:hypothetical protein
MPLISGLDPGKQQDPAALVVCEQSQGPDPTNPTRVVWHYCIRHIQSWPLGTPYSTVGDQVGLGEQVRDLYADPPLAGSLVAVGQAGVGEAVVDILRGLRPKCTLIGLVETGGMQARQASPLTYNVSKYQLASLLVALFFGGRVSVARNEDGSPMPLAGTLAKQLASFKEKQSQSGHQTFEADKPQDHDDLVMALCFALWLGERCPPLRKGDIGTRPRLAARMPAGVFGNAPSPWGRGRGSSDLGGW